MKLKEIKCKNCGGELQFLSNEKMLKCGFCGSKFLLDDIKDVEIKNPDAIIVFKSDQSSIKESLITWLKQYKFIPDDIEKVSITDFSSLYIPLYYFNVKYSVDWTATSIFYEDETFESYEQVYKDGGIQNVPVTKTRQVKRNSPASGRINLNYNYVELASSNLDDETGFCKNLFNKHMGNMTNFSDSAIKQHKLEPFTVLPGDCHKTIENALSNKLRSDIGSTIPGDSFKGLNWTVDELDFKEQRYYIPVWIVNYEYNNEKYKCLLDGIDQKLGAGSKPDDPEKIKQEEEEVERKKREEEEKNADILQEYKDMRKYANMSYLILTIYLIAFYITELLFYNRYAHHMISLKVFLFSFVIGIIGFIIFFKITKAVRNKILKDSKKFLIDKGGVISPEKRPKSLLFIFKIIFIISICYYSYLMFSIEKAKGIKFPKNVIEWVKQKVSSLQSEMKK